MSEAFEEWLDGFGWHKEKVSLHVIDLKECWKAACEHCADVAENYPATTMEGSNLCADVAEAIREQK